MNIQSWIVLAIVALCVIIAIKVYRKKGSTCSCGSSAGSSKGCGCGCSGCAMSGSCKPTKTED